VGVYVCESGSTVNTVRKYNGRPCCVRWRRREKSFDITRNFDFSRYTAGWPGGCHRWLYGEYRTRVQCKEPSTVRRSYKGSILTSPETLAFAPLKSQFVPLPRMSCTAQRYGKLCRKEQPSSTVRRSWVEPLKFKSVPSPHGGGPIWQA
jgi:hypothetical protein